MAQIQHTHNRSSGLERGAVPREADGMEGSCQKISYKDLPVLTAIELPFFALSRESAFEKLGGEQVVSETIRGSGSLLHLRFQSENCIQSPLEGELKSTGGALLLRVRRKKVQHATTVSSSGGNLPVDVQVVGRVDNAYVFQQPADYQFLPGSTGLVDTTPATRYRTSSEHGGIHNNNCEESVLETIPRPFYRITKSTLAFFGPLFSDHNEQIHKRLEYSKNRKKKDVGMTWNIGFEDPVPSEPKSGFDVSFLEAMRRDTKLRYEEVTEAFTRALQEKPSKYSILYWHIYVLPIALVRHHDRITLY
jgi:Tau95 Triple barrel domain